MLGIRRGLCLGIDQVQDLFFPAILICQSEHEENKCWTYYDNQPCAFGKLNSCKDNDNEKRCNRGEQTYDCLCSPEFALELSGIHEHSKASN